MKVKDLLEIRKPDKAGVGVAPYIEIGDIDIESKQYTIKEKTSVAGAVNAYEGEILVSTVRPTRGAITVVKEKKSAVSGAFAILRPNTDVCEPRYLFFLMNSKPFLDYLGKKSKGATYPTCSKEDVVSYEIQTANLEKQKEICNELECLSKVIALRKLELKKLDELIKARFVEMFDLNNCEYKTLGECTDFVDYRGHTPELSDNGTIRMVNAKSVGKGFFKYIDEYITEETYDSWMHKGFGYPGDILFVTEGHTFGNTCLIPEDMTKFALGQRVITIKGHNEIKNAFLCSYMQTDMFCKDINVYRTGGTAQGIRSKDLVKVHVPIPDTELQIEFMNFVKQLDKSKFIDKNVFLQFVFCDIGMKEIVVNTKRKVLLVGNGLNLPFKGAKRTDEILKNEYIKYYKTSMPSCIEEMPFPMKAVVATKDNVASCMKELADAFINNPKHVEDEQKKLIQSILDVGFDAILTTNYSLEFEKSVIEDFSRPKLYKQYRTTEKGKISQAKAELGIFQYVELPYVNPSALWHIHGIAVRQKSMVMGQEYYGKLMREVVERAGNCIREYKTAQSKGLIFAPKSWVDIFLISDVHCFGFGFDLSESDLWWLLSCKKRNFPETKFYFYSNSIGPEKEKILECYDVVMPSVPKTGDHVKYYHDICEHIKNS